MTIITSNKYYHFITLTTVTAYYYKYSIPCRIKRVSTLHELAAIINVDKTEISIFKHKLKRITVNFKIKLDGKRLVFRYCI